MEYFLTIVLPGFGLLIAGLAFLWVGKWVKDLTTPYKIDKQIAKNNLAVVVSLSGYLLGTTAILIGAALGPSAGFQKDLLNFALYGSLGIFLLNVSRFINDKIILHRFSNSEELINDQNTGVAAVEFGSYVASGLAIAGAIHGTGGGVHTALAFWGLSQLALIIFSKVYNIITPHDVLVEIEKDNIAAGIALGGTLIALGIIFLKGASGDFVSWGQNLTRFFSVTLTGFIFLPLTRVICDKIFLPKHSLNELIFKDKNVAAGFFELSCTVSMALLIVYLLDFSL